MNFVVRYKLDLGGGQEGLGFVCPVIIRVVTLSVISFSTPIAGRTRFSNGRIQNNFPRRKFFCRGGSSSRPQQGWRSNADPAYAFHFNFMNATDALTLMGQFR